MQRRSRFLRVNSLKVPPRTKVAAMITIWAVTYESDTTTEVIVDATNFLLVQYYHEESLRICSHPRGCSQPKTCLVTKRITNMRITWTHSIVKER